MTRCTHNSDQFSWLARIAMMLLVGTAAGVTRAEDPIGQLPEISSGGAYDPGQPSAESAPRQPQRATLGVELRSDGGAAIVETVQPQSPAAQAGVRVGDELISIDGQPVTSQAQLERRLRQYQPGRAVDLAVRRDGHEQKLPVTLGAKRTAADMAQEIAEQTETATQLLGERAQRFGERISRIARRVGEAMEDAPNQPPARVRDEYDRNSYGPEGVDDRVRDDVSRAPYRDDDADLRAGPLRRDARAFSDKVARHPEGIGSGLRFGDRERRGQGRYGANDDVSATDDDSNDYADERTSDNRRYARRQRYTDDRSTEAPRFGWADRDEPAARRNSTQPRQYFGGDDSRNRQASMWEQPLPGTDPAMDVVRAIGASVSFAQNKLTVTQIQAGGPADEAGLRRGDQIAEVDGREMASARDVARYLNRQPDGKKLSLKVERDGWNRELGVTIADRRDAMGSRDDFAPADADARRTRSREWQPDDQSNAQRYNDSDAARQEYARQGALYDDETQADREEAAENRDARQRLRDDRRDTRERLRTNRRNLREELGDADEYY